MALTISQSQFSDIKGDKQFSDYLFSDLEIDSWFLPNQFHILNCKFVNCNFGAEVNFQRGVMKNVTFDNCNFVGSAFDFSMLNNTTFQECKMRSDCSFQNVGSNNLNFNNCFIVNSDFSGSMFIGSKFTGGSFTYNKIEGLKYRVTGDLFNNMDEYEGNSGSIKRL